MTRQEVMEKTKKVISDCFPDMDVAALTEDSVINTETAIDSMGFVLVICKLEALFDIKIPERQRSKLQTLGEFDLKTSSWIETPDSIRKLGGALFCERRYGAVFTFHNGADSYYSVRGWRGYVLV